MTNTKHNKAIARTIVGLGTLWAGAVIWASISGQSAAVSAIEKTSLNDPIAATNSAAVLDSTNNTHGVVQSNSTPAANLPVSVVPAVTNTVTAQPTPAAVNTGTVGSTPVTPAPAIIQAPVVTNQSVLAPAPRIRTRAS
jgi:hypothetical protein